MFYAAHMKELVPKSLQPVPCVPVLRDKKQLWRSQELEYVRGSTAVDKLYKLKKSVSNVLSDSITSFTAMVLAV